MFNSRMINLVTGVSTALLLAACSGGSAGESVAALATMATEQSNATAASGITAASAATTAPLSTPGEALAASSTTDETSEPFALPAAVAEAPDETSEPRPLS